MSTRQLPIAIPGAIARPDSVVGADALLAQVQQGIAGIKDRIAGIDLESSPAACIGPTPALTFNAESQSFALDVAQAGGATSLVNYILRSGQTYNLPVIVGGNGVFLAQRFRIVLWQRLNVPSTAVKNLAQGAVAPLVNSFFPANAVYWTTKFSCFPVQPSVKSGNDDQNSPSINYRWNIQDPVTGFNYSDQLMPASAILNRTYMPMPETGSDITQAMLFDGDWHEFDSPWRFDKAYQMNVLFRPVTDIIQFDSSISGTDPVIGLPYDDRVNGKRNQAVSIQVEFQGERIGGS